MVRFHPGLLFQTAQVRQLAERLGPVSIKHGPECLQVRPLLWVLKSRKAANQQRCNVLFLHEIKWGARAGGKTSVLQAEGTNASVGAPVRSLAPLSSINMAR